MQQPCQQCPVNYQGNCSPSVAPRPCFRSNLCKHFRTPVLNTDRLDLCGGHSSTKKLREERRKARVDRDYGLCAFGAEAAWCRRMNAVKMKVSQQLVGL